MGQRYSKPAQLLCCRTLLKQYRTSSISTNQCVSVRRPIGEAGNTDLHRQERRQKKETWLHVSGRISNEPDSLEVPFRLTITDTHTHICGGLRGDVTTAAVRQKGPDQGDGT